MIGGYNDIMITLSSTATLPFIQTIVVYTKTQSNLNIYIGFYKIYNFTMNEYTMITKTYRLTNLKILINYSYSK